MVGEIGNKLLMYTKEELVTSIYIFGNGLVVIPIFTGIVIAPFLAELNLSMYLKLIGMWWIFVGSLNAAALYLLMKREIRAAKYTYIISAVLSLLTGTAFWIAFFMTLVCISMIRKYERV